MRNGIRSINFVFPTNNCNRPPYYFNVSTYLPKGEKTYIV